MNPLRAYRFRLYPSKKQMEEMNRHRWIAKNIWNDLLAYCKETYEKTGRFPTKTELQARTKNSGLFSQAAQEISHRLHASLMRFLKLKKSDKKAGFPRFKNIERMKSIHYPQFGFELRNKLKVTHFGEISIVKHREVKGRIKTLTLKREESGKWFAIFISESGPRMPEQNDGQVVGIDLGLKAFATLSNGTKIENPRHLKKYEDKLASLQRRLSRKRKGSGNRNRQKSRIARLHEKISDARKDFLHKLARNLVDSSSFIALEKLASQKMSENNYGKQINDAGWHMFTSMLAYKAESAGCQVVFVNPRNTSKTCSRCGHIQDMLLSERVYNCKNCGIAEDRDINLQ